MAANDAIEIHPYNPLWPELAAAEIGAIQTSVGAFDGRIEHIGSTAVPGLAAKPILDLLVGVRRFDDAYAMVKPLEEMGYSYWRANPDKTRLYLVKGLPELGGSGRTHHVHIVELDSPTWDKHVAFRDYLRAHPEERARYQQLKLELAQAFRDDREAYTDAKAEFISEILRRA